MAQHIAFLRGINIGGKHLPPMRELVEIFQEIGCRQVMTYIQSGHVVFVDPGREKSGIAATLG